MDKRGERGRGKGEEGETFRTRRERIEYPSHGPKRLTANQGVVYTYPFGPFFCGVCFVPKSATRGKKDDEANNRNRGKGEKGGIGDCSRDRCQHWIRKETNGKGKRPIGGVCGVDFI